jgi:hypothetical protein
MYSTVGVRAAIYQIKGFAVRIGNLVYNTVQYMCNFRSSILSTSPASRRIAGNASKEKWLASFNTVLYIRLALNSFLSERFELKTYAIRTARLASLTRVARLEAGSLYVETVSPKR